MSITNTSLQLWPKESIEILKEKKINIKNLKKKYKHIYFPWNDSYDKERTYYSLRIQHRPLFIIKPVDTNELESILDYVYRKTLTIRICGGRHSTQLLSPEVLVDMSKFNNIYIKHGDLVVGAGVTQGQATNFLFKEKKLNHYSHFGHCTHSRSASFPGGSAESVGVCGISTIGGIGVLARTFGLTIDYIISFIITIPPNGDNKAKTITVTKNKNHDLFWALCGGGGNNFGIISQITYSLFDVNDLIEYNIKWDFSDAKNVINIWDKIAYKRPNEFTEEIDLVSINGKLYISLNGFYVIPYNQSEIEAKKIVEETLENLGGELTIYKSMRFCYLYHKLVKNRTYFNFSILQGIFTNHIDINTLVDSITKSSNLNGRISIGIELLGGKISENTSGSFGFRDCKYFIVVSSNWENLVDSQAQELWLNCITKSLVQNNGVYLGFPITFTDIPYSNKIYYGDENYHKLVKIKDKYDPKKILSYSGTI